LSVMTVTTFMLSKLTLTSGFYTIMAIFTVRMFGMSLVMMPVMTNGLNQLPMSQNPHGTAMNNTLQQISGAIGSAVLITVMNGRMEKSGLALMKTAEKYTEEQITQIAMLDGVNFAFFVSTILAAIALFLAFFIRRVDPNESKLNEGKI